MVEIKEDTTGDNHENTGNLRDSKAGIADIKRIGSHEFDEEPTHRIPDEVKSNQIARTQKLHATNDQDDDEAGQIP